MATVAGSLQNRFLNTLRKEGTPVSVYLVNGIGLQGQIESYDQHTIMLKSHMNHQIIFKHTITTILPAKEVSLA